MTTYNEMLSKLECIKNDLEFLLEEIAVLEHRMQTPEQHLMRKTFSSDIELSDDVVMLKNLLDEYGVRNNACEDAFETVGLAYGT